VFCCKASLIDYLRASGRQLEDYDALVWLNADLTPMQTGIADFEAVIAAMQSAGAALAVCPEPAARSLGQTIAEFPEPAKLAPFARMIAAAGLSPALPYVSSGLFFTRSAALLERWMNLHLPQSSIRCSSRTRSTSRCTPAAPAISRSIARNGRRKALRSTASGLPATAPGGPRRGSAARTSRRSTRHRRSWGLC
jgi:hypothetical protein